jgi:hypothetical protein
MTRFAPVTSTTEPAALLGRGRVTSAMSAYQARHYNCRSDKARWRGGNQARQRGAFGGAVSLAAPGQVLDLD